MHSRQPVAILACVAGSLLTFPSDSGGTLALQAPERRVIEVIVKRYEFVPPTIEVTRGERVRLVVKSGDGLHGFGVKKFNLSKEIPRGATVNIDFTPDTVGEFPILCTEFCGDGHEEMKGVLIVRAVQP